MSNYVIITDTSADIPADILDKGSDSSDSYGIPVKMETGSVHTGIRETGTVSEGQGFIFSFPRTASCRWNRKYFPDFPGESW